MLGLRRTIQTKHLNMNLNSYLNKRSFSGRISRSKTNKQQNNNSNSNNTGTNSNNNEPTLTKHALKTILTYAIPGCLFIGFSYFTNKKQEQEEFEAITSGKESFSSFLGKIVRGEWKEFGLFPRKELMKVTRLNDSINNYNYCIEKKCKNSVGGSGKKLAELVHYYYY